MAIMTTSKVTRTESTEPKITLPFLWKDSNGIIYVRQSGIFDVAVGGCVPLTNVGKSFNTGVTDEQAWNQRLSGDVSVTLRNFFS